MASTKIINVSKSDSFEEVFGLFQNAEAQEVILIIPKSSKLAKQEAYFTVLKKEADSSDKLLSLMTEDPAIENFARLCGIQVLAGPSSQKSAKPKTSIKKSGRQLIKPSEMPDVVEPMPVAKVAEPEFHDAEDASNEEEVTFTSVTSEQEQEPEVQVAESDDDVYQEVSEERFGEHVGDEALLTAAPIRKTRNTLEDIVKEEEEYEVPIKEDKKSFNVSIKKESSAAPESYVGKVDRIEAIWKQQRPDTMLEPKKKRSFKMPAFPGLPAFLKKGEPKPAKPQRFRRWPTIAIGIAIVVIGIIAYATLGSAKIIIQPRKDTVDFKLDVKASPEFSGVVTETNQVPGQEFSVEKEVSDTFPASGEKTVAQKAHGMITIYSNAVGKPQRLVATTRFEAQNGLIFRIQQTVTVPGATQLAGGKIAPGSLEVEVWADKPGPEYNIGPTSFTIPGFKGSPQYTQFSAISTAAMVGGIIGPSKVVTEEDFSKAQQQLEQKLREAISLELKDKILDLKVIGQDTLNIETPVVNAKAEEAAPELKMSIRGSIHTVAFKEEDLDKLIDEYLKKKNGSGFDRAHSKLDKAYENVIYNSTDKNLTFTLHVTGTAAASIDQEKVISDILGMRQDMIKTYFNGVPEVSSVKIVLSPFWVNSIPLDPKRVKISIED